MTTTSTTTTDIPTNIDINNINTNNFANNQFLKTSPMLDQYIILKKQVPDAVLFFRMGDFYEMFGQDAVELASKLEIKKTTRNKNEQENVVDLCGVPHRNVKTYILKLLKQGYKVAIAEQVQNPSDGVKGILKREIVKIYTPGCLDEDLEDNEQNYIMSLYEDPNSKIWTALLSDVSTGELKIGNLANSKELLDLIEYVKPKEILIRKFLIPDITQLLQPYHYSNDPILFSVMEEDPIRNTFYQEEVISSISGNNPDTLSFIQSIKGSSIVLAGFIKYLTYLHINTDRFLSVHPLKESNTMILTETERRDLELFETIRTKKTLGSLYSEINKTSSPMGARLLKKWLLYPLMNKDSIIQRQNSTSSLIRLSKEKDLIFYKIQDILKNFPDIERIATKISTGVLSINEIIKLRIALRKTKELYLTLTSNNYPYIQKDSLLSTYLEHLSSCDKVLSIIENMIKEDVVELGNGDGLIREGLDADLDKYNNLSRNGEEKIREYERKLRNETDIPTLKIKLHNSLGLLIEITKLKSSLVPSYFIKKQSMINCERYVTEELMNLYSDISSAKELAIQKELQLYNQFISYLKPHIIDLVKISASIARIDILLSFSRCAIELNYCVPSFSDHIDIKGSRHPSIEHFIGTGFIPNDICIDGSHRVMLITGPNMGGKSTVMRQVAITAILAQIGSFVPARSAIIPIFDRIFTRVGASDDISAGKSTFMVEMSEAANILRNATIRSLIILDEIGRGTSNQDGLTLASSILEELAISKKAFCFFTTHYHELVSFCKDFGSVCIYQTEVLQENGTIVFTHRLIPGSSGKSFGIEVAKLAGIPDRVISRAIKLQNLYQDTTLSSILPIKEESSTHDKDSTTKNDSTNTNETNYKENKSNLDIPSILFKDSDNKINIIINKLNSININRTTPIKALNILDDMQSILNDSNSNQKELFD